MTLLQAVNGVLRRLRENTVSTVNQTAYSTMIVDLVNDAYEYIGETHDWLGLEANLTVTTSSGTATYELDGAGETSDVKKAVNTTSNDVLTEWTYERILEESEINPPSNSKPTHWAVSSRASDGDPNIIFRPTPDGVYSINIRVDKPITRLSVDTDVFVIPSSPIVQMAYGLALAERGDTGGTSGSVQLQIADQFIQNAILGDISRRPEKQQWYVEGEQLSNTNFHTA